MLHDQVQGTAARDANKHVGERRRPGGRVSFPCELVVAWFPDVTSAVRLSVIDSSPGGFRVESTMPFMKGMTGLARTILPEGVPLNRAIEVVWCRRVDVTDDEPANYEAGLHYI